MKYDFKKEKALKNILNRVKDKYNPGPDYDNHVRVVSGEEKLSIEGYAGMGDMILHDMPPDYAALTEELIEKGALVETFTRAHYYKINVRDIKHFDDVKWGIKTDGSIVIYKLAIRDNFVDELIEEEDIHLAALERIKKRIALNTTITLAALSLEVGQAKETVKISPIITDVNIIPILKRQGLALA